MVINNVFFFNYSEKHFLHPHTANTLEYRDSASSDRIEHQSPHCVRIRGQNSQGLQSKVNTPNLICLLFFIFQAGTFPSYFSWGTVEEREVVVVGGGWRLMKLFHHLVILVWHLTWLGSTSVRQVYVWSYNNTDRKTMPFCPLGFTSWHFTGEDLFCNCLLYVEQW